MTLENSDLVVSAPAHGRTGFVAVLSLTGRADIEDSQWLHDLPEFQSGQAPGRLVIDLSRVPSMDWWVAIMLGWARRTASRRGVTLELVSPQPAVARLLDAADPGHR